MLLGKIFRDFTIRFKGEVRRIYLEDWSCVKGQKGDNLRRSLKY